MDSRLAPGRNDVLFERIQTEFRERLFGSFRRTAVVVKSEVGRLQVARYGSEDPGIRLALFASIDDAIAFLDAPATSRVA